MVFSLFLAVTPVLLMPQVSAEEQDRGEAAAETTENGDQAPSRHSVSSGLNSRELARDKPDQALWLETGDSGQVLVLFEAEQGAKAQGAVLILGDEGQSADVQLLGSLRPGLAERGWAAMTVGLPELPPALAQARRIREQQRLGNARTRGPEADSERLADSPQPSDASVMIDVMSSSEQEQLQDAYARRVQAQLTAALGELQELGYRRIVVAGIGRGAGPVSELVISSQADIAALIWIAPRLDPPGARSVLEALSGAGSLPVLDIASNRSPRAPVRERQALARRQGVQGYAQQVVAVPASPVARNGSQVANRLDGWLRDRQ